MAARWEAKTGLTPDAFKALDDRLKKGGYRIVDISAYDEGGRRYGATWEQSPGPVTEAHPSMSAASYQATFEQMKAKGYRLARVCGFELSGSARYAAIWEQASGPVREAKHGMTSGQYQTTFDQLKTHGYRLIDLSGYTDSGQARYAAIWEQSPGPEQYVRHGMTAADFQAEFDAMKVNAYRLRHVAGYCVGGTALYAAIWERVTGPYLVAKHGLRETAFAYQHDAWTYQGFRPRRVSGFSVPGGAQYAAIWESQAYDGTDLDNLDAYVGQVTSKWNIPAASLAIAKDDRLVWAKAYGYADRASNEAATVHHRFRIASLTKAMTAATVLSLQRDGVLDVRDKVFGPGALLGEAYGSQPYSDLLRAITLRELLQHTVGAWPNDGSDPMFHAPGSTHSDIISWTIDNRPLPQAPGSVFAYSNFGYCVVGRIIERVTGQSYPNAVLQRVLGPSGVRDMEIGGFARKAREVSYYGQGGDDPTTLDCQRMDSHGGWIASAIDLARFLVRIDQVAARPDILPKDLTTLMSTGSTANAGYGMGLAVNAANNWFHSGGMPGTTTFMARIDEGFSWVVLTNTRPSGQADQDAMSADLDRLMWKLKTAVTWPSDLDLF